MCINGESDTDLAPGTYSAGQALFSRTDPTKLLKRSEENFFKPTEAFEITGQVGNVCFLEGMVYFKNKWLMYYGTADSKIAVAETSDYDYAGKMDPRKRGSSSKKPMFQPVRENFSPEVNNRRQKTYASPATEATVSKKATTATPGTTTTAAKPTAPQAAKQQERDSDPASISSSAALHPEDVSDVTVPPATSATTPVAPSRSRTSDKPAPEEKKMKKKTTMTKKVEESKSSKNEEAVNLRKEKTNADADADAKKTSTKEDTAIASEEKRGHEDKFML